MLEVPAKAWVGTRGPTDTAGRPQQISASVFAGFADARLSVQKQEAETETEPSK